MKYRDILGLYEHFQPVYDIANEVGDHWKRFIPNDRFYDILQTTLNALESGQEKDRKPLWMQGSYGTGKTHAMAVIKHLLWDDGSDIESYLEGSLDHTQLREKLRHFRKQTRIFPVILKGVSNITNNRTFALVIERAVKTALQQHGIQILTQTDFEKLANQIHNDYMKWDKLIAENPELSCYLAGKDDLLNKIQGPSPDIDIFRTVEDFLSQMGQHFSHENISKWLEQVAEELRKQHIADGLMLFWDEFTNFLELGAAKELLTELQHVAELSVNHHVSLFVISHRQPSQTNATQDEIDKIQGRFHVRMYRMEPITTYDIVSKAIKKKDKDAWETLKKQYLDDNHRFNPLIQRVLKGNESASAMRAIRMLFPIHPYTAYLMTFIARYLGSTERSIFSFLNDQDKGFLKFLAEHPQHDQDHYLTSDMLWEFFVNAFEESEKFSFGAILEKFKHHRTDVDTKGAHCSAVFRGILLLNVLSQVTGVEESKELVSPSVDNIASMFLGTQYETFVPQALEVIDAAYIQKTPDNLFLVSTTALPLKEIEDKKLQFEQTYKEITSVLNPEQKQDLLNTFQNGTLREIEVVLYPASMPEHVLRSRLYNAFKTAYSIHAVVFLMKEEAERPVIRSIIENLSKEETLRQCVFVMVDEAVGPERWLKFIEYRARADVAERHLFDEEKVTNEEYARKIIEKWVASSKNGFIELYCQGKSRKNIASLFPSIVNKELSPAIFPCGMETLHELQDNQNIWKFQRKAEKAVEAFLFADSRSILEENTKNFPYKNLRGIIKDRQGDYIIHTNLDIKPDVSDTHPVKRIFDNVEQTIHHAEQFHLGNALRFLTEPPYGLYSNSVNMAVMGFILGRYVGKLYEAGTGRMISKQMMRDKVQSLFKYWQEGKEGEKLQVRYGTVEEKRLTEKLKTLFALNDEDGLTNLRWGIRNWIKRAKYPLWILKHDVKAEGKKAIDEIVWLTTSIDQEITQDDIKRILNTLTANETDLALLLQKNLQKCFLAWLYHLDLIQSWGETTAEELYAYLVKNMQEEIPSWNESNAREKVKRWKAEKKQQEFDEKIRQEREFIALLQSIFGFDEAENLHNARWQIRQWIEMSQYPLWVFKPSVAESEGALIDEFVQMAAFFEKDIAFDDMQRLSTRIQASRFPLKTALQRSKARESFVVWLQRIQHLDISDDCIDEIVGYVKAEIPKSVALWEESEVREKIREWQLTRVEHEKIQKRQIEHELSAKLAEIFDFDGQQTLKNACENIRAWVKKAQAPLWVFKMGACHQTESTIQELIALTLSSHTEPSLHDLKRNLHLITGHEKDLQQLFRQDAPQKFVEWINRIEQVEISKDKLPEIYFYLTRAMSPDIASWAENDAREQVKTWQLTELRKIQEQKKKIPTIKDPNHQERLSIIKQRVVKYRGDTKPLLLRLLETHPTIYDLVEEYLNTNQS